MPNTAPPRLQRLVFALALSAALAVLAAAASLASSPPPLTWGVAASAFVFVAALVLLQRTSFTFVYSGNRRRLVLDEIAVFAGLLFLTPALVVALAPVGALLEQAMTRRERLKAVFNVAQTTISIACCAALAAALFAFGLPLLLAALPAAFLYPLLSNALLAHVFAALELRPASAIFRERLLADGLVAGAVGAGGGVAVATLAAVHPATLLSLLPFAYLTHRHGVLSALADREVEVRKRLAEVGHELVGTTDLRVAAERILDTIGDVLPACGEAELTIERENGALRVARRFGAGPRDGAPLEATLPGRDGTLGRLTIRSRPTTAFAEGERDLLRVVAAQSGAAIEATRALANVERARARLDTVLTSAGDALLVVDSRGVIQYANPAARALFGVEAGARSQSLFADPSVLKTAPGSRLVETRAFDAGRNREMLVEAHATPLLTESGEDGVLLSVRDVTERKRLEGVLARQEKLSALGTLVAGVAHEINNPVTYMRGAIELAALDLEDASKAENATEEIRALLAHASKSLGKLSDGVERVDRITHSLKAVARQGNGERRLENLNAVAEDVAQVVSVALPKGVRLDVALGDVPPVSANASELHQVVLNLVKNAVEALAHSTGRGAVSLRTRAHGDAVFLDVADDGPGIPPEVERRLFEPFFTTKAQGTGLGLSLCKGIVEAHGGELTLSTAPGKGAVFTVRLPAPPAPPASRKAGFAA